MIVKRGDYYKYDYKEENETNKKADVSILIISVQ